MAYFLAGFCARDTPQYFGGNTQGPLPTAAAVRRKADGVRRGNTGYFVMYFPAIVNNKEVDIICIGSMFKSWALLQSAFVKVLREQEKGNSIIRRLLYVNDSSAIGAARYTVMYLWFTIA